MTVIEIKKIIAIVVAVSIIAIPFIGFASYHFSDYKAAPPIHVLGSVSKIPLGLNPAQIKAVYGLPSSGGHGTIAIIGAYNDATIEADLGVFSKQYGLPACTTANGCFEKHLMNAKTSSNSGWAMETSLDAEWAHAIAPQAKILLVDAATPSAANLLAAIDYARGRSGVVAVSMSFGGAEFPEETALDSHFTSSTGIVFFASSGDNGTGASWPAASPNVVAVGGTSLSFGKSGMFSAESAWSGSGGGVSAYETEPAYQKNYSIAKAGGMRSIPDVSYNADPRSGYSIYKAGGWYVVGGTSASAPQWAAIESLGLSVSDAKMYADKSGIGTASYFRDIKSGTNGDCGYYCTARAHYDYVTGLGSPLTVHF